MFKKVAIAVCLLSLTDAAYNGPLAGGQPADLYPAALDPRACPNFPHCTNAAVAASQDYPLRQPNSNSHQTIQRFKYQRPVYQPRHTATPLVLPQKNTPQPQFEFMPSPAQKQQYIPRPQYIPPAPVHEYSPPQKQYRPQYATPQQYTNNVMEQQYTPEQKKALDRGEYIGDGDYHGEGLAEALTPGYYGQQQSHRASPARAAAAAATPAVHHDTPAYQKVSEYLAQSQNARQSSAKPCQNYYGFC